MLSIQRMAATSKFKKSSLFERRRMTNMGCVREQCRVTAVYAGLFSVMLSSLLSRSLCQAVAGANRTSLPALCSALLSSTSSGSPKCGEESDLALNYSQLNTMISNRDIQLFDVRTPEEYQAGYIADAVNIPLSNLDESLKLSPEQFHKNFGVNAPGKDDGNIVFYCRSGNRSAKALTIAYQQGFYRARHYKGGYSEWAELQGKPICET